MTSDAVQYQRDRLLSRATVNVLVERLVATHIRNSVFRNSRIVASFCSITGGVQAHLVQ